jgi:hypothetical protein
MAPKKPIFPSRFGRTTIKPIVTHQKKFHECSSKFCLKDEIERRMKHRIEEVINILTNEIKMMIADFKNID